MGRFATETGSNFHQVSPGTHAARCIKVIDLGTHREEYKGQKKVRNKIWVCWEIPGEMVETDDGMKPAIATNFYTNSLGEKATLRQVLEAWRGRAFTPDELKKFDLANILGKPCLLTIIDDNGKSKIASVSGLPRGMECPAQVNPSEQFWIEEWDQAKFDALSNGIKGMILESDEYKARATASNGKQLVGAGAPVFDEEGPDSIPF